MSTAIRDKWLRDTGTVLAHEPFELAPLAWDARGYTIVLSCRRCGAVDGRIMRTTKDLPEGWRWVLRDQDAIASRTVTCCAPCVAAVGPPFVQETLL